ncbi:hypothetical protein FQN49_000147 [Arthroderma sp. PD_2]|nr:hypothetical protein FQN49_000147 [Arthroderma sp. PD_2]
MKSVMKIALGAGTSTDSLLSDMNYVHFSSGDNAPAEEDANGQKGVLNLVLKPFKALVSLFSGGTAQPKIGENAGEGIVAGCESEESGPLRDCYKVVAHGRQAPVYPLATDGLGYHPIQVKQPVFWL